MILIAVRNKIATLYGTGWWEKQRGWRMRKEARNIGVPWGEHDGGPGEHLHAADAGLLTMSGASHR